MKVSLTINKENVYDEVGQTTEYTGDKMTGDEGAYERIRTTDADRSQLDRFWNESVTDACEAVKRYLDGAPSETASAFTLNLELSASFDAALQAAMSKELFSFFVTSIAAKWYAFTNKQEAGDFASAAASMLEGVRRKACFKKKPVRPTY